MTRVARGSVLALLAASASCAKELPPLPLRPEPVAYADTLLIPEPEERGEGRALRTLSLSVPYDLSEPFTVDEGEALNRTHFDDVVGSAWWEPRLGYARLTPEQIAAAHLSKGRAPALDGIVKVRSGKVDGATPGFVLEDAKGDRYIVKFDPPSVPFLQSTVGILANRLMWGAGYWVPEDYLATLDSTKLTLDEDATMMEGGKERPMTMDDVHRVLARAHALPDGRFRVVASKYLPGIPKGPSFMGGVRDDDPNDHYRHEHRRELRGLRVISAWLNDTDRREGNTLDVYVEPGYLRHYQIDFAASLGSSTDRPKHPKDDVERPADLWRALARILTLGFYKEGWEDQEWRVTDSGVGFVKVETFDPDDWESAWDNPAFYAMSPADAYWGAKIVSAFSNDHLRAAVREAQVPNARVADTLVTILAARRDITVRRYFSEVAPIEAPSVASAGPQSLALAFRDLGIEKGIWTPGATRYAWRLTHPARGIERSGSTPARAGEQRLDLAWEGAPSRELEGADALGRLEVLAVRDAYHMPSEKHPRVATIWLRWNGSAGRYEVVGLEH
jgi:hypothetical protein